MKVAIEIRTEPGLAGGTAPALRSLIRALGDLDDGPEEYVLVVQAETVDVERVREWLGPLAANQSMVVRWPPGGSPQERSRPMARLKARARRLVERIAPSAPKPLTWPTVTLSDGFFESLGCDLLHFPTQYFTLCAAPCVYNPHDLQHLHYPEFFDVEDLVWREINYPAGCHFAKTVIVNSQWTKNDVVRAYGVDPGKVQVVPEAPPTQLAGPGAEPDLAAITARYGLGRPFALSPGVTWPHKNHLRLIEAIAHLRDHRGLIVDLVCTGARHDRGWPKIEARIAQLSLGDQVKFVGFVPEEDLRGLYRLAKCLVLPSLFEANSLPVFEAWLEGAPVASSDHTAMPEQVGEAGLLFDPMDPVAIAATLERLFTDAQLCADLREKGLARAATFNWTQTAKAYRAVYRRAAGRTLTEEDRFLLASDWMSQSGTPARGVRETA